MELLLRPVFQNDGAGGGTATTEPTKETTEQGGTKAAEGTQTTEGEGAKGADGREATWLPKAQREAAAKAGIKVPTSPAEIFDDYLKLKTSAGGVKVPGANASPEEIATYRKAVGVPDSPENYKLERPKLPEGMPYDEGLEKLFRAEIHKMGVPATMATGLYNLWNRVMIDSAESRRKAVETSLENAKAEIIKEIGEDEFKRRDAHANSLMEWSGLAEVLRTAATDAGVKKKGFEAAWKLAGLISPATLDKASGGRQPGGDETRPVIDRLPVLPKDHPKATRR